MNVSHGAMAGQLDMLTCQCHIDSMSIAFPEYRPEAALGFDHLKSVQTIAYFVRKAGGTIQKLKLIKLIYLAERRSFERRGRPMNFDSYLSLPHGPIASSALNGIDHNFVRPEWDAIALANKRDVSIAAEVEDDRLSRADRAILDAIWDEFGGMTASQIRNWTHDHCAEYVEVGAGASLPIDFAEILEQVGNPDFTEAARELRALQKEVGRLERLRAA